MKNFQNITEEMTSLYLAKQADYGDSFTKLMNDFGLLSSTIRLSDKIERLKTILKKQKQMVADESVRDTLMDLANYAAMSVLWIDNSAEDITESLFQSEKETSDDGKHHKMFLSNFNFQIENNQIKTIVVEIPSGYSTALQFFVNEPIDKGGDDFAHFEKDEEIHFRHISAPPHKFELNLTKISEKNGIAGYASDFVGISDKNHISNKSFYYNFDRKEEE